MSERFDPVFESLVQDTSIEVMELIRSPMKEGGVTYWDELEFKGKIIYEQTGDVVCFAGLKAMMTAPVLLHEFMVPIEQSDMVRRASDGAWFRVSGKRMSRAYAIHGRAYACVPVERCEPPEQYQSGGSNDEV